MNSGKAKAVKKNIQNAIPANTPKRVLVFLNAYKNYKKVEKRRKLLLTLPKGPVPMGKQHDKESWEDFKKRRKASNAKRRLREKLWKQKFFIAKNI